MAASTESHSSMLKNFIHQLNSRHATDLLETLTGLRNNLRSRREGSRIEKFRKLGGLEILIKVVRDVCVLQCERTGNNATGIRSKLTEGTTGKVPQKGDKRRSDGSLRLELLNMGISALATCCTELGSMRQAEKDQTLKFHHTLGLRNENWNCCHCILCFETDGGPKVQSAGGISILGKVLQNETCWNVINRASRAVANLAKDADICTSFHKQDFISCLVRHLFKSEEPHASYSLVRALRTLSDTSEHRLSVINQGGVKAILRTLDMNDDNLTAVSVETLAEMTHPYLFNHLKKPSWRALWDTVGSQSADSMPSILKVLKTGKQSISDQALVLLNNLMNCKEVRLAVGRCGEIPEFVKLCEDASHPNFLPYLQCFALCCKESVNRAKVRESDGLDVLLKVLKNSEGMQERHVALAGLVHFYHDNLALKYLCTKGLIKSITKYLGEYLHYLQGDMKVCEEHFSRHYYKVPAQCSDSGDETARSLSKSATPLKKSSIVENEEVVGFSPPAFFGKMATSTKPASSLQIAKSSGGTSQRFSSSSRPSTTDTDTDTETFSQDPAHGQLSPKVTIDESPIERSSSTVEEDFSICDEYSQYVGQNAAVYSPPRVDWSSVFACREQQGYRGLSPQSDLSSRSNSMERDIPKYQYSPDWSLSPKSDVSWAMAGEDPEIFQYSPVVSDEEDDKDDEMIERATSPHTTPERPSKVSSLSGNLGFDKNQSSSTSKKFAPEAFSPSVPIYSPAKRSRSPSVDSSYDSEALEDFSDEEHSKPEGYALHLLSKCSCIDDTLEFLAVFEVIDVLLKLVLYVPQFQQRSTRILNRILGNRLTFEQLVKEGIPRYLKTSWRNAQSHSNLKLRETCNVRSGENPVDSSMSVRKTSSASQGRLGNTEKRIRTDDEKRSEVKENDAETEASWCPFLDKLASVCESRFGLGVLAHGVTSPNLSQRLAVLDAIFILCRSQSGLHYLLCDSGALDLTMYFLRRKDLSDSTAGILNGLQNMSGTLNINLNEGDRLLSHQLNVKQRKLLFFDPGQDVGQVERKASAPASTSECEYELSEKCKDVRLVLSDKNFIHASREFLCQRSEYFSLLLQGSYKESRETEVSIPNISRPTLERILHYLYGCQLHQCSILNDIDLESGMELLAASGRFLLPELQRTVAESSLQNQIAASNVAAICIFASIHGCQYLWSYCIKFMLVNDQVSLSSFQKLSESSVAKVSFSKMKSVIKNALKVLP